MKTGCSAESRWKVLGRAAIATTLCGLMVDQPLVAEAAAKKVPAVRSTSGELQGQERVLHALSRLTFGPRPGDVAAVERTGLDRWFEEQLNPSRIDDSRLDAKLMQFPAMQLSVAKLEQRYPGPQMIRQMAEGRAGLPSDLTERAMVRDEIAFYQLQKANKEKNAPAAAAEAGQGNGMEAARTASSSSAAMPAVKGKKGRVQAGFDALNDGDGMMARAGQAPEKPVAASEIAPEMDAPAVAAYPKEEIARLIALPPDRRMQEILAMPAKDLVRLRAGMRGAQQADLEAGLTPQQREVLIALPGSIRMVALEAMESRLMRDIASERQLEAVMTDFWLNHFNVYVRKNQSEPYLIPSYEREAIRPHALGRFEDLLVATAESPAMLVYLDNFRSVGPDSLQAGRLHQAQQRFPNAPLMKKASAGLNENYGRELMELHTLGVNGGYTQDDVTNVAKVFTGWGIDRAYQGGEFSFEEKRHEPGSKVVLGRTIHEGGMKEGLEVLHMLATSPATAHFISGKLAVRFVSDNPPPALVERMASSYLKSDGDIKTVLRTMWKSSEFWSADVYRAKVKTPEEFVISAVRASGSEVENPQALVQSLDKLGMPLYGMQTPNGYSWMQDGWVSTGALVSRMNFALVLSGDRLPGVHTGWSQVLSEPAATLVPAAYIPTERKDPVVAKEQKLEALLLGRSVSERTRSTVLGQANDATVTEQAETQFDLQASGKRNYAGRGLGRLQAGGAPDDPQAAVMAGLLLGSPEFQRR